MADKQHNNDLYLIKEIANLKTIAKNRHSGQPNRYRKCLNLEYLISKISVYSGSP